jgi:hypothetical protein
MHQKNREWIGRSLALTAACSCNSCGKSLSLLPVASKPYLGDHTSWAQAMAPQVLGMGWAANGERGGFRCPRCPHE